MSQFLGPGYDYSGLPGGEIDDPSRDMVMQDEHGRWRVAVDGKRGDWLHMVFPSRELASLNIRRRQATFDGDFRLAGEIVLEMEALWKA